MGRFFGNDLYAPAGQYLGEIIQRRLYVRALKKEWTKVLPSPYTTGTIDYSEITQGWN